MRDKYMYLDANTAESDASMAWNDTTYTYRAFSASIISAMAPKKPKPPSS